MLDICNRTAVILCERTEIIVSLAAKGMGSSGNGTMQGFGNTAFSSSSKYATV